MERKRQLPLAEELRQSAFDSLVSMLPYAQELDAKSTKYHSVDVALDIINFVDSSLPPEVVEYLRVSGKIVVLTSWTGIFGRFADTYIGWDEWTRRGEPINPEFGLYKHSATGYDYGDPRLDEKTIVNAWNGARGDFGRPAIHRLAKLTRAEVAKKILNSI